MTITESDIRLAMAKEPRLTPCGIRHERFDDFEVERQRLVGMGDQVQRACDWLAAGAPGWEEYHTSYGLKHAAERWAGDYISNGAMIAALILGDCPYKKVLGSLNVEVGKGRRHEAFHAR